MQDGLGTSLFDFKTALLVIHFFENNPVSDASNYIVKSEDFGLIQVRVYTMLRTLISWKSQRGLSLKVQVQH